MEKDTEYILTIALQNAKFLRDVLDADAIPDYKNQLENVYNTYTETGYLPSIGCANLLYNFDLKPTEADINIGYHLLQSINDANFREYMANAILDPSISIGEAYQVGEAKFKKKYNDDDSIIIINSNQDYIDAYLQFKTDLAQCISTVYYPSLALAATGDNCKLWRRASIYCIQGLSGYGKSLYLCNLARDSVDAGYNTLYLTTEMTISEVMDRISRAKFEATNENEMMLKRDVTAEPKGQLIVKEIFAAETTAADIETIIKLLPNIDIVYIDYADYLSAGRFAKSEYDAQGFVYNGLKTVAKRLNIPIVTATQTGRGAEADEGGTKKHLGYAAIADSIKKVREVDILFSIVQTAEDKMVNRYKLEIVKNRHYQSGKYIPFILNHNTLRLYPEIVKATETTSGGMGAVEIDDDENYIKGLIKQRGRDEDS